MKMSPQGIMSSEKAIDSPGLCPVKGQKLSLGIQTGFRGSTRKPHKAQISNLLYSKVLSVKNLTMTILCTVHICTYINNC